MRTRPAMVIWMALLIILCVCALTSCGSGEPATTPEPSSSLTVTPVTTASSEGYGDTATEYGSAGSIQCRINSIRHLRSRSYAIGYKWRQQEHANTEGNAQGCQNTSTGCDSSVNAKPDYGASDSGAAAYAGRDPGATYYGADI